MNPNEMRTAVRGLLETTRVNAFGITVVSPKTLENAAAVGFPVGPKLLVQQ